MKAIRWCSVIIFVLLFGSIKAIYADTEIDGTAAASSSFTMTGLISISTLTVVNAVTIASGTATNFTITNEVVANSTASFVHASTATVDVLTASSGTINSFMVVGTNTNDNAPSGRVGEYASSSVNGISAPTSLQWGDATSISLTPGDWDIAATTNWDVNEVAGVTLAYIGVSTTSGNSSSGLTGGVNILVHGYKATSDLVALTIARYRVQPTTTTTYYLKYRADYTGTVPQFNGNLSARRMR